MTVSKYNFPSPIKSNSFIIDDFSGVDFTTIESKVDLKRSPDSSNMIIGKTGSLDKRTGRKVLKVFPSGESIVAMQSVKMSFNIFTDSSNPASPYSNMLVEHCIIVTFDGTYARVYLNDQIDKLKLLNESGATYTLVDFLQTYQFEDKIDRKVRFVRMNDYNYLIIGLPKTYILHFKSNNLETSALADSYLPIGSTQYSDSLLAYIVDFQASKTLQYMHLYIPTLQIGRKPDGSVSTKYESTNMMSNWVKTDFLADGTSTVYKLTHLIADISLTKVYKKISGKWVLQTSGYTASNDTNNGKITFTTAPTVPTVVGEDNIRVEFTTYAFSSAVNRLTNYAFYGYNGKNDFAFVSMQSVGGAGYSNRDFRIRISDMYMSSESFTEIGNTTSVIVGYSLFNDYLVTHCYYQDNNTPALFIRSASIDNNGNEIFPMKTGKVGIGAINGDTFANLDGDTIWLSEQGVVALITNEITNTKSVSNRSYFINKLLVTITKDFMYDSFGIVYDNLYYLFTNNGCYVADPRKKSIEPLDNIEQYQYDWNYFKEIKSSCAVVFMNKLRFAKNNIIYEFRTDSFGETKLFMDSYFKSSVIWANATEYVEETIVSYGGKYYICLKTHKSESILRNPTNEKYWNEVERSSDTLFYAPVVAYWTTPIMNMGNITARKTLKNLWVRLEKYTHTGVRIYYATQGIVKERFDGIFDFSNLDFSRFTFSTDTDPMVVVTNRQERKFMSIQFKIESRDNMPLSLLEIVGKYTINNQYKG